MPRHQTSRNIAVVEQADDKLAVFRKYAQISAEIQELGSALLGLIEALLIIIATCFLYSGIIETHGNYSSFVFIAGQIISLVVNCLDCYELISHTLAEVKHVDFPLVSHFITTSSYIVGTLMIILGNTLTLSYIQAFDAAAWVFFVGSLLFTVGAVFGSSGDSLIEADQFVLFFRSLFGKCNTVGTFCFLFGSCLGVVKIWSPPLVAKWLGNILAATFQSGGVFFLLASLVSILIISHKHRKKEHVLNEKAALFHIH
jgi:hypothetical protein